MITENELYQAQELDTSFLNKASYPYKPDILMGYKGQKVGVFVLSEIDATLDTHRADGAHRFRMRLLEKAQLQGSAPIKAVGLAVGSIVNYDIEKFKLQLNKEFNFIQFLDEQVPKGASTDFRAFSAYGARLIQEAASYIEKLPDTSKDV